MGARPGRGLLALGLVGALGCASTIPAPPTPAPSPEAERLFTATLEDPSGAPVTLQALRRRLVLVEFFATWCVPCAFTLPLYRDWGRELASEGLRVVAVSVDESPDDVPPFVARHAPGLAFWRDPETRLADALGVRRLPTTLLFDEGGRLVLRQEGFRRGQEEALRAALETLLRSRR